jgi:hypothetical protein
VKVIDFAEYKCAIHLPVNNRPEVTKSKQFKQKSINALRHLLLAWPPTRPTTIAIPDQTRRGGMSVLHKQAKIQWQTVEQKQRLGTKDRDGGQIRSREMEAENIEMPGPVVVLALYY